MSENQISVGDRVVLVDDADDDHIIEGTVKYVFDSEASRGKVSVAWDDGGVDNWMIGDLRKVLEVDTRGDAS